MNAARGKSAGADNRPAGGEALLVEVGHHGGCDGFGEFGVECGAVNQLREVVAEGGADVVAGGEDHHAGGGDGATGGAGRLIGG